MVHGQCTRLGRGELIALAERLPALRALLPGVSRVHCPGFAEELELLVLIVGDYAAGSSHGDQVPVEDVRAAAFVLLAFEGDRELFGDALPAWGRGGDLVDDMRVGAAIEDARVDQLSLQGRPAALPGGIIVVAGQAGSCSLLIASSMVLNRMGTSSGLVT